MIILVTGGSGSGKSAFAEDQVLSFGEGKRIYIATMFPFDEEGRKLYPHLKVYTLSDLPGSYPAYCFTFKNKKFIDKHKKTIDKRKK